MADDTQIPPAAEEESRGNKLLDAYNRLPARHRLGLLIGVPALVAIVVAVLLWNRAPAYQVLFSGLSDQDGGTIVAALQQQKIPYRIADGGSAILVPPDQVHEVRLRLASQGLPRAGNVGFELMDNSRLGMTQFQEQVNYQRALEGELARSIQALGAVRSARVHLAIPKPSIFMREQNRPTASVLVQMLPGRVLDRTQVAGIVHLVSSSVPELATSAVSVVDQTGMLLSGNDAERSGLDATQLEYLRTLERQYVRRISELISPIVGAQNLRAQVALDLDFSRQETTDEIYRPNGGAPEQAAIRSRQSSEAREAAPAADGGVPGSLSNTPPGVAVAPITGDAPTNPPAPGEQPPMQSMRRADTTNYELDKTIRYTREPVGRIRRISAAVVVNHRVSVVDGASVTTPLGEAELAQIKALVNEAVGFDPQRRDSVSVISIPFNERTEAADEPPFWKQPEYVDLARDIGVALVLALAVLYLIIGVIRPAIRQMTAPPEPAEPLGGFGPLMAGETDDDGVPVIDDPMEKVREFARENPQLVATVIRGWISSEPSAAPAAATAAPSASST